MHDVGDDIVSGTQREPSRPEGDPGTGAADGSGEVAGDRDPYVQSSDPAEGARDAGPAGADQEPFTEAAPTVTADGVTGSRVETAEPAEGAADVVPDVASRETPEAPATAEPDVEAPEAQASEADAVAGAAETTTRVTVSQLVARRLHEAGARYCFTVPGESFLPLIDDLADVGIRIVTTRHESGAAFMAEALAQSTGRPQLVAVTRGVGASNASIGIHTARQDSAPLVALVGQVPRDFLGREAFQEVDLVHGVGSLAAWAAEIREPERAGDVMHELASRLNNGRPGPILLSLPEDVQATEIDVAQAPGTPAAHGARGPAADRAAVTRVLKLLAASERGVIVAGGGVLRARATKRLVALSEALAVPVIAAWRRPDVFPNDHVNYLGMTGYWSAPTVRQRLLDADVIVFIGARLSEVSTFDYSVPGPDTRWAHVDLAPRTAHAGLPAPSISIAADASRFLDSAWSDLRAAALDNEMRERRSARNAADREAYRAASSVGQGTWDGPGVHPGRLIDTLRSVLPDNATIATDAGNATGWLARGFRFRRAGTFLGPTSGAMGFGLPAAIAASLQDPDRIAVAVCGDGGFAMTMMELETAVREGAHPIAIVLDNERYGTIAMHQTRVGRELAAADLGPIDFATIARAHGALGLDVAEDAAFEPALREAIGSRRTCVIHVKLDRAWMSVDENPLSGS